ncbi:MAG TPA: marine proteobacterial sortase target protein, partial [Thiotrichales bacterium]|nr:marine proteobacterial sortase target protein [Thiotrichales bacterium]
PNHSKKLNKSKLRSRLHAICGLIILILLFASQVVFATAEEPGTGTLLLTAKDGSGISQALLLDTEAEVNVSAMTARVTLRQRFRNTTTGWVDGRYVFPMPENAAVNDLIFKIGERIIKGEIKEKQAAKKAYEQARAEGKRAALLESERPNLFTVSVANIEPGGEVVTEITYLQTMDYKNGQFTLRLPTTLTPRYIPGKPQVGSESLAQSFQADGKGWAKNTDEVADASRITPTQTRAAGINPIKLNIRLHPGMNLAEIHSPSHEVIWQQLSDLYEVTLKQEQARMDKDFILNWTSDVHDQPQAALFLEEQDGEQFATLMMMPPQSLQAVALPREMIFIIDSSGSMSGASMPQARAGLIEALGFLQPQDRFNIIDFDDNAVALFNQPVPASPQYLGQARNFANGLLADGGTNMASALDLAFRKKPSEGYLKQVVFMTDGSVGNETALFKLIHQKLDKARLFTVGIGTAPNSYFMRKAAEFGRGSFTYIGNQNEVQEKMTALFKQLQSPVLRDIHIQWPDNAEAEFYPSPVPDLYLGEPLIVSTRIKPVKGDIIIRGQLNGQPWQRVLSVGEPGQHAGLSTLWAQSKITSLLDEIVTGTPENVIKPQVIDLALKHHLATRYTSFVAIEQIPVRPEGESSSEHAVPNLMPAGNKMGLPFPATATSATLSFYLGLLCILLGFVAYSFMRRKGLYA